MSRVLVVEDDENLPAALKYNLIKESHEMILLDASIEVS
jgi:DNA-binding response OmpR family regulator